MESRCPRCHSMGSGIKVKPNRTAGYPTNPLGLQVKLSDKMRLTTRLFALPYTGFKTLLNNFCDDACAHCTATFANREP